MQKEMSQKPWYSLMLEHHLKFNLISLRYCHDVDLNWWLSLYLKPFSWGVWEPFCLGFQVFLCPKKDMLVECILVTQNELCNLFQTEMWCRRKLHTCEDFFSSNLYLRVREGTSKAGWWLLGCLKTPFGCIITLQRQWWVKILYK